VKNIPKVIVKMSYETFMGSGKCIYRFPIEKGKLLFSEAECLLLDSLPPRGCFEITYADGEKFSFTVPGGYLDSGKNETHTIPCKNGIAFFSHSEKKKVEIEGDEFDYEAIDSIVISTAETLISIAVRQTDENGEETAKARTLLPYVPGTYGIGEARFGKLTITENMDIRYSDTLYNFSDGKTFFIITNEKEEITVCKETLSDKLT
jgi:hypothetical protein